jgi:hypothetical protein
MRTAFEIGITVQPAIQCLFRTEEVIDRSTAADKHDGAGWICLDDLGFVEYNSNPARAIR